MKQLAAALAKAQGAIEGAKKDKKNDHFRSKYADLASVWEACRKPLTDNGLSVIQLPCEAPAGSVGLETILLHESGEFLSKTFFMPVKDAGNPQAVGSAITYARRYALAAFVSVCPDDDDGNAAAAGSPGPVAAPSADQLKKRFDSASTVEQKKAAFMVARNTPIPEPSKTELLKGMADVIKSMGGK